MQNRQDNLQKEILESLTGAPLYNKWLLSKAKGFIKSKILEVGSGIGSFTPPPGGWENPPFETTTATLPV